MQLILTEPRSGRGRRFLGRVATVLGGLLLLASTSLGADRIELKTGGEILGTVIAEEEAGNDKLLTIELEIGGQMKLLRTQIARIVTATPEELAYRERVVDLADTAEAHWEIALWCKGQRLRDQQELHLLKVIQLDPEHEDARHALGYARIRGVWATRDQIQRRYGRRADGRLIEEYEFRKLQDEFVERQREHKQNLIRWRGQLGKARHAESLAAIEALRDPAAVAPIAELMLKEENREIKLMWINLLGRIDSSLIVDPLVSIALQEANDHVREIALKTLKDRNDPSIQRHFMRHLDPKSNDSLTISRAGAALGVLESTEAVRSMIEALVTVHKVANPAAQNNGRTAAGFNNQQGFSGQFGGGGAPATVDMPQQNAGVLSGLRTVTGVDYGFDKMRWMQWYASEHTPLGTFDLRRSD